MSALIGLIISLISFSASAEPLYDTPIYDPASKSYFALIDGRKHEAHMHFGFTWDEARDDARTRIYKGVKGRMAVPSSVEIHQFLEDNFRLDQYLTTWIGLEYVCKTKQLLDSDGHTLQSTFRAWDKDWHKDPYLCRINPNFNDYEPGDFAGIAYNPLTAGFRWGAYGKNKGFNAYFIQYRTGGP